MNEKGTKKSIAQQTEKPLLKVVAENTMIVMVQFRFWRYKNNGKLINDNNDGHYDDAIDIKNDDATNAKNDGFGEKNDSIDDKNDVLCDKHDGYED